MCLTIGGIGIIHPILRLKKYLPNRQRSPYHKVPCDMHVQKGATHNLFDFYGDVIDPIMAFLR